MRFVSKQALGSLHRVPWARQTFAEGSAAAQKLKNTAVGALQTTRWGIAFAVEVNKSLIKNHLATPGRQSVR